MNHHERGINCYTIAVLILCLAACITPCSAISLKFWRSIQEAEYGTAREQFEHAQSLENDNRYGAAMDAYQALADTFPDSPLAPESQFKVAEMLERAGHYYAAFNAYQAVLDNHPSFPKVNLILERQFKIGNLFLQGKSVGFLKINPSGSYKRAIDIYRKILSNAPFSDLAPRAQYNLGIAYMEKKNYIEASIEFEKVPMRYPRSDYIAPAKYQLGVCAYRQARAAPYDQEAAQEAINKLKEFIQEFPDDRNAELAKDMLMELQGKKAAALYKIGSFYEERGNPRASLIYFGEVIRDYPLTPYAEKAKKKVIREEKKVELVGAVKGAENELADLDRRISLQKEAIKDIKSRGRKRWQLWRYAMPARVPDEYKSEVEGIKMKVELLKKQRALVGLNLRESREILGNRLRLMRAESLEETLGEELRAARVELQVAQNRLSEVGELPEAELNLLKEIAAEIAEREGSVRGIEAQIERQKEVVSGLHGDVERREGLIKKFYVDRRGGLTAELEGTDYEAEAAVVKRWWWPFGAGAYYERRQLGEEEKALAKPPGEAEPDRRTVLARVAAALWPFGGADVKQEGEVLAACEEIYKEAEEHVRKAQGFKNEGRWDEAYSEYDAASLRLMELIKIWPAYRSEEVTELLRDCSGGIKDVREEKALAQHKELLDELEEEVRRNPEDVDALFSLGAAYQRSGKIEKAIDMYRESLKFRPDDSGVWFNMAIAMRERGDFQNAISAFKKAIANEPGDAKAHHGLGMVYREVGDYSAAEREFKISIDVDPSFAASYFSLGRLYQSSLDRPDEAVLYWREYLKLRPDDPGAASIAEWIDLVGFPSAGKGESGASTGEKGQRGLLGSLMFWKERDRAGTTAE